MRAQLLGEWKAIARCLERTNDPVARHRLSALGAIAAGYAVEEVARWFGVSRQTLYNWEDRLLKSQFRPESLADGKRPGRPSQWDLELITFLEASLQYYPRQFGYPNINWTVELLQDHLVTHGGQWFSDTSIRRQLHAMGYVWKRARYVLEPDPEREKKKRYQETPVVVA